MSHDKNRSIIEEKFEWFLWNSRFMVMFAVIFGLLSALVLFIVASLDVVFALISRWPFYHNADATNKLISTLIGSIDVYLIAVVIMLFSFGLYELFISKIDIGQSNNEIKILEITSLDQLKSKLMKVIIMVLVVSFFKKILNMPLKNNWEMFLFALSILALSSSVYLMHKNDENPPKN